MLLPRRHRKLGVEDHIVAIVPAKRPGGTTFGFESFGAAFEPGYNSTKTRGGASKGGGTNAKQMYILYHVESLQI
jgi:hypothetical protein